MKIDLDNLVKRVPGTGDFIKFNPEECTMCGYCLVICIMNLWRKRNDRAYLAEDYQTKCLECGACYQVCEGDAIDFTYPAGGTGIVYEKG